MDDTNPEIDELSAETPEIDEDPQDSSEGLCRLLLPFSIITSPNSLTLLLFPHEREKNFFFVSVQRNKVWRYDNFNQSIID